MEDLVAHLGQGHMDAEAMVRVDRIRKNLPSGAGGHGGLLWRTITVAADQYERLCEGEVLELDPRPYECWSRSRMAIRHLLRLRAGQARSADRSDGQPSVALMLCRDFPRESCILDVEALFRASGAEQEYGGSWNYYAGKEQEIIVSAPGGRTLVSPEDVAEKWSVADPDVWAPEIGEVFWGEEGELIVEELIGLDDCGNFEVRSGDLICPLYPESYGLTLGGAARPVDNCYASEGLAI
ncbi:hypothetical protein AB9K35_17985 [Leisingera sp. XS_AS12]|uniref:hypothetical protein n=1 Tax=Leisingera sp. XS_AS12 TaxID=3241294 RepID=UPI003510F0CB